MQGSCCSLRDSPLRVETRCCRSGARCLVCPPRGKELCSCRGTCRPGQGPKRGAGRWSAPSTLRLKMLRATDGHSKDLPPAGALSRGAGRRLPPRAASDGFGERGSGAKWVSVLLREGRGSRLPVLLCLCLPAVSAVGCSLNLVKPLVKSH